MSPDTMKALRATLGLSQAGLAEEIGRTKLSVGRYESGASPIPEDVAAKLRAMGSSPVAEIQPEPEAPAPLASPTFDPLAAGLTPWGDPPAGLVPRDFVKNPLGKGYQVCGYRVVSALIPGPLPFHPPAWAGSDAIVAQDGRCYHYRTGLPIKRWEASGAAFVPNYTRAKPQPRA